MKRQFGPINQNHVPVGGYQQFQAPQSGPNYISEQGIFPSPGPTNRQMRRAGHVAIAPSYPTPAMDEFENEFVAPIFGEELGNHELPTYAFREQVKQSVHDKSVTIIVGETGSGKSTQTPQILLEAGHKVSMTQPRRIAAYMVADRIQSELSNTLGVKRAAGLVGYQTAEKSTVQDNTRITVITDGIEPIKQLYDPTTNRDMVHIIDEVHEWNTNIEFTLGLARQRVAEDPTARFVLMSATVNAEAIADFFEEASGERPNILYIPGRTHEITRVEEPESFGVEQTIKYATEYPDKGMLVFVGGKQEIAETIDNLHRQLPQEVLETSIILPLHAKLPRAEQARVSAPTDKRKIIVSTNVAQTSITFPEVDIVIDTAEERRVELDEEGTEGLKLYPISQSDCNQRAGRCGRVRPGIYVHTRYNATREFIPYESRPAYQTPEILRTNIDRTVLRAAAAGIDMQGFRIVHPVDDEVIRKSKLALYNLGGLDEHGHITSLGTRMDSFPVRPSSARMIMEALPYSATIQAQLAAVVASIEVGGLPYFVHGSEQRWQELIHDTSSDLLAQLDIFTAIQGKNDAELEAYDLDVQNVRRAQELYSKIIRKSGNWEGPVLLPNASERQGLKRAVYAGLINGVYQHAGDDNYERMTGSAEHTLREISRRSVVAGKPQYVVGTPYRVEFMMKGERVDKHILESVTVLDDPRVLAEVAPRHMLGWESVRQVWRGGVLQDVQQLVFNSSIRLGVTKEVDAHNTGSNQNVMVQSILENPGPAQKMLRATKERLEYLQHLTVHKIPQITQDALIRLLNDVVTKVGFDQPKVDNRLREIIHEQGWNLDAIISPEEQAKIIAAAPKEIQIGTVKLALQYHQGVPVIAKFKVSDIKALHNELYLADNRQIMFWHGRRRMTLADVRADFDMQIIQ